MDQTLQVLAPDVLHRQEEGLSLLVEVVHPADVLVPDLAGRLDLVPEALDHPPLGRDLGLDELEGDFLVEFRVVGPIDTAHAARAQLLDDFVPAGKQSPSANGFLWCFKGPGDGYLRCFWQA